MTRRNRNRSVQSKLRSRRCSLPVNYCFFRKFRRPVADVEPSKVGSSEIMHQDKKERMDNPLFVLAEYDPPLSPLSSICFVLMVISISRKTQFSVLGGGRGVGRGDLKIQTSSIEL